MRILMTVERESDLFQVILTACPVRRLAHFLDRRQKQPDEDRNNGDDHKELDQ
jgi:hypothetical protein